MVPETARPTHSSSSDGSGDKHKSLDREVRDMLNAITSRVTDLQKSGGGSHSHHHQLSEEDEHGVRIITLAGTNTGATMRTELDDNNKSNYTRRQGLSGEEEAEDALGTYVNSNFQAINNSIMMGGSYSTNDPGVHLDISELFEQHGPKPERQARKGKKKEKETIKSDHQTEHSD